MCKSMIWFGIISEWDRSVSRAQHGTCTGLEHICVIWLSQPDAIRDLNGNDQWMYAQVNETLTPLLNSGGSASRVSTDLINGQNSIIFTAYDWYWPYASMDLWLLSTVFEWCDIITYMTMLLLPGLTSSRHMAMMFDAEIKGCMHLHAYCPMCINSAFLLVLSVSINKIR